MAGSIYQKMTIVLAASETRQIAVSGSYLRILSNSSATYDPIIRMGSSPEQSIKAGIGIKLSPGETFGIIVLRNPNASGSMTVEIASGDGQIDDSSLVISGSIATVETPTNTLTSPAAIAVNATGTLIAADSTIRERIMQNNGTKNVWVGATLATTIPASNQGIKIAAGASMIISSSGAVAVKCAAGETSTLSILNISKV